MRKLHDELRPIILKFLEYGPLSFNNLIENLTGLYCNTDRLINVTIEILTDLDEENLIDLEDRKFKLK